MVSRRAMLKLLACVPFVPALAAGGRPHPAPAPWRISPKFDFVTFKHADDKDGCRFDAVEVWDSKYFRYFSSIILIRRLDGTWSRYDWDKNEHFYRQVPNGRNDPTMPAGELA